MIPLFAQTDTAEVPEGKICHTYHEFSFYAQKVIECEELKNDTAIYCKQIRVDEEAINLQAEAIEKSEKIIENTNKIVAIKEQDYSNLYKKYEKHQTKLDRCKKIIGGFAIVLASTWAYIFIESR